MLHPKRSRSNYFIILMNVNSYMVPPALPEVGQPVSECDLEQFEGDAADPAHPYISDNHHLEPPAHQMRDKVNVHCRLVYICELVL
jgi:hypothetical protein